MNIEIVKPEKTTKITDFLLSTHAASQILQQFQQEWFSTESKTVFHPECKLQFSIGSASHSGLISLKMWKMKFEAVKQTTNSIHCIYGFYSRTIRHKILLFFNIQLTSFQSRFIYGKLLLIQSKQVRNLAFFLLKGDLFAEKFCEFY